MPEQNEWRPEIRTQSTPPQTAQPAVKIHADSGDYTWDGHPLRTSGDHIVELETALHKLTDRVRALELTVHMLLNPNGDGDE